MRRLDKFKGEIIMKTLNIGNVCSVTRKVIKDYNNMNNKQFYGKYSCSKRKYYKRVMKYGDPYMNAPLAKLGKLLNKLRR